MKKVNSYLYKFFLFSLLPFSAQSQGEFNNWYFGHSAGITFNAGSPAALTNCPGSYYAFNFPACISDSLGNLLFYTDDVHVYNRNHVSMLNSNGLATAGGVRQPFFIIQTMGDDSLYYLFTMDLGYQPTYPDPKGLCYSMIDMRLDGGFGGIIPGQKNIQVTGAEQTTGVMTGARHKNNRDAWIVVRKYNNSNEYLSYKITSSGIFMAPIVSYSLITILSEEYQPEVIKISPDGNKLACVFGGVIELCQFNCETGVITPKFLFDSLNSHMSVEFSRDSRFFYVEKNIGPGFTEYIYQYDLSKSDSLAFVQSETFIGQTQEWSGMQLGPDNKIYVTVNQIDSVGVINHPEIQGLGCDFQRSILGLVGNVSFSGFPQYLNRYYVYPHSSGHCQGRPVHFSMTVWPPPDSLHWNFGDPSSGSLNFSNDTTPFHIYTLPGQYTVELFVRHIDNRTDTSWLTITIHETPNPDIGADQTICQGDSVTLDAGFCNGCTYEWTSIPPGFSSTAQTVTLNQSGVYAIAVTTTDGCTGRDTMQLSLTLPPVVTNNPLSTSICSGESTGIPLTSNMPDATFSWTAIGSSPLVTGFSPGSGDTINQVLTNWGSIPQTVTYWITPAVSNCIGDSVQYIVMVTPGDSVNISISASVDSICDGTPVTFNATTINGGNTPYFQWKVDGLNQGTNDSIFTYIPINRDTITCILTSSNTSCIANNPALSNAIRMTVYPDLPVSVSVSTMDNPVCDGNAATLIALTSNKGASPDFQWVVNGNPVGTNDSIFAYTPSNGDQVFCRLTSSEQCTSNNPATSDTITMIVNPLLTIGISISASANPICEGLPVTFTATPFNGGAMPAYQWQVNGINSGPNNPDFTYTPGDGDLVTCSLTSNAECITNNPATSNPITMSVGEAPDVSFTVCFDTITTLNAKPFKLKGGIPLGGAYSGPGVDQITGYFNPAMAGVGLKTVRYSYTNQYTCSNYATRTISVVNPTPLTCGDSLTDIRDNKKYPTIQIGSQCWLAANLNYGVQISGSQSQRDNCIPEKYCVNDIPALCALRSVLYQWDELMRYEDSEEIQGLCPPGWHVPSEADWNQLFAVYQGNAFAGKPLLYTGYSGFNVLLAGVEFLNQSSRFVDFASIMWSSTSHGPYKAWSHGLNEYNYSVSYYPSYRSNAFSVRCLRD